MRASPYEYLLATARDCSINGKHQLGWYDNSTSSPTLYLHQWDICKWPRRGRKNKPLRDLSEVEDALLYDLCLDIKPEADFHSNTVNDVRTRDAQRDNASVPSNSNPDL